MPHMLVSFLTVGTYLVKLFTHTFTFFQDSTIRRIYFAKGCNFKSVHWPAINDANEKFKTFEAGVFNTHRMTQSSRAL